MIDLHSHILHNFDDGPRTLEAALELAQIAVADGVTTMVATPHGASTVSMSLRYSVPLVHERLDELRAALQVMGIPLEVLPGTELYGEPGLATQLRAGQQLRYGNSQAVLVEFPSNALPTTVEQVVFELQLAGYRVVVAHPERIRYVQEGPNALVSLVERGALMQLTADALLGVQGERLRRVAETLLLHRLVQIIATDAHGRHVGRMPNLGAARARAAVLLDEGAADALVRNTPAALLRDAPLDLPPPEPVRKRFGLF